MNMTMNPVEYAEMLHTYGFTFEDFAAQYPNLADSDYGTIVKATLNHLNK